MNVENLRQALIKFDHLRDEDTVKIRSLRSYPPIVAAYKIVEAPSVWWCELDHIGLNYTIGDETLCVGEITNHTPDHDAVESGCGWVRLVPETLPT